MSEDPKNQSGAGKFLVWMIEPDNMRRFEAKDPTITIESDVAIEYTMHDEPDRGPHWLSWNEWNRTGKGRHERLHPEVRRSFIRKYTIMIKWIEGGVVDARKDYGMSPADAADALRKAAEPFIAAQEEYQRDPYPPER